MSPRDAVLTVLRGTDEPVHWTVVLDRALRAGYLDSFRIPDVRRALLTALAELVAEGAVEKQGKGVYRSVAA